MAWFKKKKDRDFISPSEEQEEMLGESTMKGLLNGRILVDSILQQNMRFILFLAGLGVLYIWNGFQMEKLHMTKVRLEKEVSELRFESISTAAELTRISTQSHVLQRIHKEGIDLIESKEPPIRIED